MADALHVAVRTLHVFGMVVLLGGAAAAWHLGRTAPRAVLSFARRYEWAFWGALGVLVVTGVGNLGALGAPGPGTRWGTVLLAKLGLVVAFVLGSVVRTLAVAQIDRERPAPALVRRAYGATTTALVALVVLAEVLAHG